MADSEGNYPDSLREYQRDRIERARHDVIERLRAYERKHGDLLVPTRFRDEDGYYLGTRVGRLRRERESLDDELREALDEIGFVWEVPDAKWEQRYASLCRFADEHGHGDVPTNYEDADGIWLGNWLGNIRKRLEVQSPERISRLRAVHARLDTDFWLDTYQRVFGDECPNCGASKWVLKAGRRPAMPTSGSGCSGRNRRARAGDKSRT